MAGRTSSTNTRARVFAFRLRGGRAVRIKFFYSPSFSSVLNVHCFAYSRKRKLFKFFLKPKNRVEEVQMTAVKRF